MTYYSFNRELSDCATILDAKGLIWTSPGQLMQAASVTSDGLAEVCNVLSNPLYKNDHLSNTAAWLFKPGSEKYISPAAMNLITLKHQHRREHVACFIHDHAFLQPALSFSPRHHSSNWQSRLYLNNGDKKWVHGMFSLMLKVKCLLFIQLSKF